jgi:hypothetical protein
MLEVNCAELNDKTLRPKLAEHGETVKFLPSAAPKFGFLVSPSNKTVATDWLPIGDRCRDCNGYGVSAKGTPADAVCLFISNIESVQAKVTRHKKWTGTKLGDIFKCTCKTK